MGIVCMNFFSLDSVFIIRMKIFIKCKMLGGVFRILGKNGGEN